MIGKTLWHRISNLSWGLLLLYTAVLLAVCIILFWGKPMDWLTITFLTSVWYAGIHFIVIVKV